MSHLLSITGKESRAFFRSPIAIIFLAVYLAFTFITFFFTEQFFARNIADLRPMFTWLPVLLVFLASALTMRQWSEEQKMGTLEVLFTLPVRIPHLVLGKFFASLALVTVALALTLPIPVMVSMNGALDWGPVLGGYIGAVLLAGAYLSIGLFISALTDNQIVSLIGAVVVSALFWAIGSDPVVQFFGRDTAEILTSIGTGSRFESIRRGVLDLRDLVYYFSLIATFLTLNGVVLTSKGWSDGTRTAPGRAATRLAGALVVVNAIVLNLLVADVTALRIDMTERQEYTISPVTRRQLATLTEPLLIRGYFSEKTHPLLEPLVPQIRDTIREYGIIGGDRVRVEFIDPQSGTKEEQAEVQKEAEQKYGIKSSPFQIASAYERSVTNSYFSILVQYGDEFEVLNYPDLIEVTGTGPQDIQVKLRNLEYDLTSAVKKVSSGFQTLDALFATLEAPAKVTAFVSQSGLPESFAEMPARLQTVLERLADKANGQLEHTTVDPTAEGSEWTPRKLVDTYGIPPLRASLLSTDTFYFGLAIEVGDRPQALILDQPMPEADLEGEIVSALERGAPGFLKTVGIAKPETPDYSNLPPQIRQQMPPPPPDLTRSLQQTLSEGYTVETVDLKEGRVPGEIDVLLVFEPDGYDDKQAFAVDQHLMRGGTVIVVGGRYAFDASAAQQGLAVKRVTTGLEDALSAYGLRIEDAMVMDPQSDSIPLRVPRDLGGFKVQEIQYLPYPLFVDVRSDGMADTTPVTAGLPSVTVPWASPVIITASEDAAEGEDGPSVSYTRLLRSSERAWTKEDTRVMPDLQAYPELGFAAGDERDAYTLAVMASGRFDSAFAGKDAPEGITSGVLERSTDSARLVVIGSSAFLSDVIFQLSQQAESNLRFAQNLIDWGLEDTDLLSIRSRGTFARTLEPLDEDDKRTAMIYTAGASLVALIAIAVLTAIRRNNLRPIELDPPPAAAAPKGGNA